MNKLPATGDNPIIIILDELAKTTSVKVVKIQVLTPYFPHNLEHRPIILLFRLLHGLHGRPAFLDNREDLQH